MPFRAPKMYGFIFGFHRLVWCPKCTPASSRFFMVTSVIAGAARSGLPSRSSEKAGPCTRNRAAEAIWTSLAHRVEEVLVPLGAPDLVVEELHGLDGVELRQQLPQDPDPVQHLARHQQLLLPGPRARDVHGREHAPVHQAPVEVDLHVPGAFELLEDDLVHAAAGVDERGADDGEAPTLLDVARGAEELLRTSQRVGVDAAGQDLPARGYDGVVGAGEPGDGVEEDDDVAAMLDQPLRLLDDH